MKITATLKRKKKKEKRHASANYRLRGCDFYGVVLWWTS